VDVRPGGVSPEEMSTRLRDVGLPGELADELRAFLASCEEVRFAPAAGDGDMRRTLSRAESLVRALERSRHLGRAAAAVLLLLIAAGARAASDNPQAMFFRANGP